MEKPMMSPRSNAVMVVSGNRVLSGTPCTKPGAISAAGEWIRHIHFVKRSSSPVSFGAPPSVV